MQNVGKTLQEEVLAAASVLKIKFEMKSFAIINSTFSFQILAPSALIKTMFSMELQKNRLQLYVSSTRQLLACFTLYHISNRDQGSCEDMVEVMMASVVALLIKKVMAVRIGAPLVVWGSFSTVLVKSVVKQIDMVVLVTSMLRYH